MSCQRYVEEMPSLLKDLALWSSPIAAQSKSTPLPDSAPLSFATGHGRVLITGASGLLGREVLKAFQAKGCHVKGLAFSRATGSIVKCNLLDSDAVTAEFESSRPNIIIHCAAERRPDQLEKRKEYAMQINAVAMETLAKLASQSGAWMVYLSTNYVFDGTGTPYSKDARPNPLMIYGVSKLAGEEVMAKLHPQGAVLRVPLLCGPIEHLEETLVTALFSCITAESPKLDNWQERFPTNTEDLALVLEAFASAYEARARTEPDSFKGIFHWQANEKHTKYTMGVAIAEIAGIDSRGIVAINQPVPGSAPRPQFERMLCSRLERLLGIEEGQFRSGFEESMARHLERFVAQAACDSESFREYSSNI